MRVELRVNRRAGPQRAAQRVEQARGDFVVATRDRTPRGGEERAILDEIDADLLDLQELGDALHGGLEGVREREP